MTISGITHHLNKSENCSVCVVENFSEDIKSLIRTELTKVCHGPAKALSGKSIYSYKQTLREFLRRYQGKTAMTKLGMLGELLCHVLLFYFRKEFSAASPFFNMEEGSIKKGFDIIVSNGTKGELWITEIKSGEVGASEKDEKVRSLIDKARLDLLDRIASDNTTIWHGAINNVELALASSQPSKSTLIKYLDEFLEGAQNLSNQSSKANVILAPILFEDTKNPIDPAVVSTKAKSIIESSSFNKSVIFAIQKSTISRLEEFLNDEAAAAP